MKQIMIGMVAVAMCVALSGCGDSPTARYEKAMSAVITDADEYQKELQYFKKLSKDEQIKGADYAEYFALLKKTTPLGMREIKKMVERQLEGMDANQRKKFLKKCHEEVGR